MDVEGLAQRWRIAREAKGFKMNELDRALGQSSGFTSRVERAEKPGITLALVAQAAQVLEVSLDWLAFGREEEGMPRAQAEPLDRVLQSSVVWWKPGMTPEQLSRVIQNAKAARAKSTEPLPERFWLDYLKQLCELETRGERHSLSVVTDAGTDDPLDDLGSGAGAVPKLPRKGRKG